MPSSVKLRSHQKSRLETAALKALEDAGSDGISILRSDDRSMDVFIDVLPTKAHRYFSGRNEKIQGFKTVLREMEHNGKLDVTRSGEGDETIEKFVLAASPTKKDRPIRASKAHPNGVRATHAIANGVPA